MQPFVLAPLGRVGHRAPSGVRRLIPLQISVAAWADGFLVRGGPDRDVPLDPRPASRARNTPHDLVARLSIWLISHRWPAFPAESDPNAKTTTIARPAHLGASCARTPRPHNIADEGTSETPDHD